MQIDSRSWKHLCQIIMPSILFEHFFGIIFAFENLPKQDHTNSNRLLLLCVFFCLLLDRCARGGRRLPGLKSVPPESGTSSRSATNHTRTTRSQQ